VGRRTWTEEIRAESLAGDLKADTFALLLHWPRSAYLTVAARRGQEDFRDDAEAVFEVLARHGIPRERVPREYQRQRVLIAEVSRRDVITLDFIIDTNDSDFLSEAGTADGVLTREIEVVAAGAVDTDPTPGIAVSTLHISMEPARRMEKYQGCVALDLGNTSSTLVCLDNDAAVNGVAGVEVVNAERKGYAGPVLSAVRINRFAPAKDEDALDMVDYVIGTEASQATSAGGQAPAGWLVLGAKRLLADTDLDAKHEVWLGGQKMAFAKRLPAELFISGMFRAFHEEKLCVPRQIAITCPTTFSSWEIEQLREAVVQGWRRSLGATVRRYDRQKLRDPDLPQMILDEASAAAFYFLYRDFISAAGGLDVFNYLYPRGLNLLVYDCGGGTTDIALVHASAEFRPTASGRAARLKIQVLGRTGHRSFGGDDITIAVFKVLKAKIASRLGRPRKLPYPDVPGNAASLTNFLEQNRRDTDAAVPTIFTRENLSLEENRRRMKATFELWQLAEQLKVGLGKQTPCRMGGGEPLLELQDLLSAHHKIDREPLTKQLLGLEVNREEVDVLIRDQVTSSIDYANRMIAAKLPDSEVHWVYVVGNASLYPLIHTMIEERLDVPFIRGRLKEVREEDLKSSVAKGAVLALRMQTAFMGVDIAFDGERADRLPYSITFSDRAVGGDRILFREHEQYGALTEKQIAVPDFKDQGDQPYREIYLGRQWPGDDAPSPFLRFEFREAIRGPIAVWYDAEVHQFLMRDDGGTGTEVMGLEQQKAMYCAPVQSGKL
jgi:hypothetical protein